QGGRHAHTVLLDQRQMNSDDHRRYRRQYRDMKAKEPSERRAGNVVSSTEKSEHRPADERNDTGDLGPDLGGKESQFVPRKKVSAEPEPNSEQQEQHPAQPGDLARPAIGPHEIDAEHVNEQGPDHQIGRPAMHGSDQPAELHLGDDELDALKCGFGARPVVQQQKNAGADLHAEKKQGHAAEVIPDRVAMNRDFFLARELSYRADAQAIIEPKRQVFCFHKLQALETPISSPRVFTTNSS